jgi:FixJ family two-component response regulator
VLSRARSTASAREPTGMGALDLDQLGRGHWVAACLVQINRPASSVGLMWCRLSQKAAMQRSGYIAIVDDDASMRKALARLLRVHGINSRNFPSARALFNTVCSSQQSDMPDCLIVDVNMPEMTGIELQRELLKRDVRIPTIVISASDDKNIVASAAFLGAVAFFTKPVPGDALVIAINSAKKRHHLPTGHGFDRSAVVVDWLDACRSGQLNALLDLYEQQATLICDCDQINLAGRNSMAVYWKSKLESRAASAFILDGMTQTGDEIEVDCQSCKGKPVRIHFRFSPLGKILHTRFAPIPRSA